MHGCQPEPLYEDGGDRTVQSAGEGRIFLDEAVDYYFVDHPQTRGLVRYHLGVRGSAVHERHFAEEFAGRQNSERGRPFTIVLLDVDRAVLNEVNGTYWHVLIYHDLISVERLRGGRGEQSTFLLGLEERKKPPRLRLWSP